jgi:putative acetyltransferase
MKRPADVVAIHDLTQRAFAPMPYADGDEQDVIDRLRATGALSLSLVAEQDGVVVGQVTFSPATAPDGSVLAGSRLARFRLNPPCRSRKSARA